MSSKTAVIDNRCLCRRLGKDVLAFLFPPSLRDSKQERLHEVMECIIGKGFAQHVSVVGFTSNVDKVYNAAGNRFTDPMVGTRMMFLLQNGGWDRSVQYHTVVVAQH